MLVADPSLVKFNFIFKEIIMERRQKTKEVNRCSSLLKMLKEFCGYTSVGGLGRVVGSKFIVFKVLWFVIFLGALGWAIYQLNLLFGKYRSKPISTKISLHYNATLAFPSVVLCNFNMIRKSVIPELPARARTVLNAYISDVSVSKKEATQPSEDEEEGAGEEQREYNPDALEARYKQEEMLSVVMASLDEEHDLTVYGHQFETMIRSCTFKGVDCRNFTKNWSQFWNYKYGNCFIFNPYIKQGKQSKGVKASKPGPLYGLRIEMDIQQDEYIDKLTQNAGAVILISDRKKMHFPYEEGHSLAPGFSTSMGLRLLKINREDPFKNDTCIRPDKVDKMLNVYNKPYNVSYSKTACEQSCLAQHQKTDCKCMEYKFPYEENVEICNILNKTTAFCLENVSRKARNNQLSCSSKCRPLCSDQVYQISSSFSSWPSQNFQKHLAKELEEEKRNYSSLGRISNNLLKLHVFFQELNYEVIDESISYQLENFLSDIGGQLGLWLGVSVLSGVEVLELLAVLLISMLSDKGNAVKMNDSISMEEGGGRDTKKSTTAF